MAAELEGREGNAQGVMLEDPAGLLVDARDFEKSCPLRHGAAEEPRRPGKPPEDR